MSYVEDIDRSQHSKSNRDYKIASASSIQDHCFFQDLLPKRIR
jgi:hypothetical protein